MASTQEGTITMIRPEHLIQTLHLFSPSLPIGAFAFSQGLEAAIESGASTTLSRSGGGVTA